MFLPERKIVVEVESRNRALLDQKNQELAEKVAEATLDQIKLKLEADIQTLKQRVESPAKEALEIAKDQKYLKDRQKTFGQMQSSLLI